MHAVDGCGMLLQMSCVAWIIRLSVCLCVGQTNVLCKDGWTDSAVVLDGWLMWIQGTMY